MPYRLLYPESARNQIRYLHPDLKAIIRLDALPKIAPETIFMVGNAAGDGAVCAAFNEDFIKRAEIMSKQVHTFNLASLPEFQERFIQLLKFNDNFPMS